MFAGHLDVAGSCTSRHSTSTRRSTFRSAALNEPGETKVGWAIIFSTTLPLLALFHRISNFSASSFSNSVINLNDVDEVNAPSPEDADGDLQCAICRRAFGRNGWNYDVSCR